MCGIAGILHRDPERSVTAEQLQAMGDAIAHRGPDAEGYWRSRGIGLAHRRLAIIDLADGQQPMGTSDGKLQVVFNGEIYNYRQLRSSLVARGYQFRTQSDTEVLLHLYREYGADLVAHLRGMFCFALWDEQRQELILARDRVGQKPLFVACDRDRLVFGSELKAVLASGEVIHEVADEAVCEYLHYGFITAERSIFRDVQKLPAAHVATIRRSKFEWTPRRYWQLEFGTDRSLTITDWHEQIAEKIRETVTAHTIADVPVGAFLSGGLDSSAIVASLFEQAGEQIRTFSIGFQEREFSELPHAAAVARHFGTQHTEQIVTADAAQALEQLVHFYDEPFADASAVPTLELSRITGQHVKVALSGDGGDEAFGGYARYAHDLREARWRRCLPGVLRRTVLRGLASLWPQVDWLPRPLRLKSTLRNLSLDPAAAYANTLAFGDRSLAQRLMTSEFRRRMAGFQPHHRYQAAFGEHQGDELAGMLQVDTSILLPDDFLTKVDRASMAHGLEVRPPFVDHELLELTARLPSRWKVNGQCTKWLLKELFEPRLPERIATRAKQGFEIPIDQWLCGPLRDVFEERVLNTNAPIACYLDHRAVRQLFQSHVARRARRGNLLWSLLVLGSWLERYTGPQWSRVATPQLTQTADHGSSVPC